MRRGLVVGNWKMHGSRASASELVSGIKTQLNADIQGVAVVCPPSILISPVAEILVDSAVKWGAQNLSDQDEGAYTGEVSGAMLADAGCHYVIVGHSERRSLYGESDTLAAAKFIAALESGLTPILCVGESLQQREAGETLTVVGQQLQTVIDAAGIDAFGRAVIAYEPVWAIGTGKTATPDQAQDVHAYIRQQVAAADAQLAQRIQILYGGSVKADNAQELFARADIDGALVGGASLKVEDFIAICQAAA